MLNIAKCQCYTKDSDTESFRKCGCSTGDHIPSEYVLFMQDQMSIREHTIASVTLPLVLHNEDAQENDTNDRNACNVSLLFPELGNKLFSDENVGSDDSANDIDNDYSNDYNVQNDTSDDSRFDVFEIEKNLRKLKLDGVAAEAERRKLSNADTAAIVSSTLLAIGLITNEDRSLVVDPNRIQRERAKCRKTALKTIKENQTIMRAFYFDGKKGLTLSNKYEDGRQIRCRELMDNISIIQEPEQKFLG